MGSKGYRPWRISRRPKGILGFLAGFGAEPRSLPNPALATPPENNR